MDTLWVLDDYHTIGLVKLTKKEQKSIDKSTIINADKFIDSLKRLKDFTGSDEIEISLFESEERPNQNLICINPEGALDKENIHIVIAPIIHNPY